MGFWAAAVISRMLWPKGSHHSWPFKQGISQSRWYSPGSEFHTPVSCAGLDTYQQPKQILVKWERFLQKLQIKSSHPLTSSWHPSFQDIICWIVVCYFLLWQCSFLFSLADKTATWPKCCNPTEYKFMQQFRSILYQRLLSGLGVDRQQHSGFLITGNPQIKAVHFSGRCSNIHQALIQE